ncbi:MAG TPA: mannosyltransferase family protein [Vicinamibacterales bacterium]|nr:mannosyltransferase family protein [Vicinamibacterales bacterium]
MTPPRWVRALDGIAVAVLLLGVFELFFGGFALGTPPFELQLRNPWRILFVGAAAAAIRHAAFPQYPLHRRLWGLTRASGEGLVAAAGAFATRVAVLVVAYFAVLVIGTVRPGFQVSGDPLFNLPARFDAGWYAGIALDGYSFQGRFDRQQNVAFFPAFPLLMRAAGYLVGVHEHGVPQERRGGRLLWGGTFLSILAFAWAAIYIVRLTNDIGGREAGFDAAALASAYPFAVFFSAPYTESLFLLGAVAAFYYFRRGAWGASAAWGVLVGLTRPNGCFLSIVLALLLIERLRISRGSPDHARQTHGDLPARSASSKGLRNELGVALGAAAAPGLGMLAYSAYVKHLTGVWFGWARLHEAWGRSYGGIEPVASGVGWVANQGLVRVMAERPLDTLNGAALVFAIVMIWPVWRRLGLAWAAFIAVNVIPPLLAGGLLSMGRITSTLFPIFIALALVLPRRTVAPVLTIFALGQALAAVIFFTWRPLY